MPGSIIRAAASGRCTARARRRMLYAYCESHGIAHRKLGKLFIVTKESDIPKLEAVYAQALANGVENVTMLDAGAAKRMEPALFCVAAFHSAETGIIDSHRYMLALQGDIEDRGGVLAFNTPVERLARVGAGWRVDFGGPEPGSLTVDAVVNSASHGAQRLARATEGYPGERVPKLVLAKGNYFGYAGRAPFSRLIYPAPVPGGLGIHVTLDLAGRMRFGPDVEWIDSMNFDVDPRRGDSFYAYYPQLLAGPARQFAVCRLRGRAPQAHRAGRAGRGLHDRWSGRARAAGTRAAVRHRVRPGSPARCRSPRKWSASCQADPVCGLRSLAIAMVPAAASY